MEEAEKLKILTDIGDLQNRLNIARKQIIVILKNGDKILQEERPLAREALSTIAPPFMPTLSPENLRAQYEDFQSETSLERFDTSARIILNKEHEMRFLEDAIQFLKTQPDTEESIKNFEDKKEAVEKDLMEGISYMSSVAVEVDGSNIGPAIDQIYQKFTKDLQNADQDYQEKRPAIKNVMDIEVFSTHFYIEQAKILTDRLEMFLRDGEYELSYINEQKRIDHDNVLQEAQRKQVAPTAQFSFNYDMPAFLQKVKTEIAQSHVLLVSAQQEMGKIDMILTAIDEKTQIFRAYDRTPPPLPSSKLSSLTPP